VVVFEGVVRNNTNGRQTTHLEYECYEEMATEQMARIGKEIAARGDISHLGMVHRLGRLQIGEASVSVVATAPHRKPAFEAALEGINRLKREVPIWKKEFFADGAVWVDGEWSTELLQSTADQ
jgi:molybdopterin synthase catalytic subunit